MYTINTVVLFVLVIYAMLTVNVRLAVFSVLPLPILAVIIFYVNTVITTAASRSRNAYLVYPALYRKIFRASGSSNHTYAKVLYAKNLPPRARIIKRKVYGHGQSAGHVFPIMLLLVGL
jgi:ATP-binding cassette subfamily B multidrug efflux pump